MKHIRALTFDLDDTLWDNRPVLMAAEQTLYEWLCRHYPRIGLHYSMEDMWTLRQDLLQQNTELRNDVTELRNDVTELRKTALRRAAESAGYDHGLVEPAFAVFIEARHRVTLYSDVVPAIQRLRVAGYRLGSLTNGNADVQRLGLGHLFDFSLTAASVGKAKPHPLMFQEACRLAQVDAAELAHVGDEPDSDISGAQNAGAMAIWMNRNGLQSDPGIVCDAEISSMKELLTVLDIH